MSSNTINFQDAKISPLKDTRPLVDVLNMTIGIKSFEVVPMGRLTAYVITTADGQKFYTFSKTIQGQLDTIKEVLRDKVVLATVRKRKNYYTLE